jgi:uncharacterized protein
MPVRALIRQIRRVFVHSVLHADDTPHRIALGAAIGVFVSFTPTIPFHMVLVLLLATLLRANKIVGLPFVWISNPFTFVPVYAPAYFVGRLMLGHQYTWRRFFLTAKEAVQALHAHEGWWHVAQAWWAAVTQILWPLVLGSLVVAPVAGVITYFAVANIIETYRARRHLHHPPPADGPDRQ